MLIHRPEPLMGLTSPQDFSVFAKEVSRKFRAMRTSVSQIADPEINNDATSLITGFRRNAVRYLRHGRMTERSGKAKLATDYYRAVEMELSRAQSIANFKM